MSVDSLKQKRLRELKQLSAESISAELVLRELRSCLKTLNNFPNNQKTSQYYNDFYPELNDLVSRAFDRWSELDDEVESLRAHLQKLDRFSDYHTFGNSSRDPAPIQSLPLNSHEQLTPPLESDWRGHSRGLLESLGSCLKYLAVCPS